MLLLATVLFVFHEHGICVTVFKIFTLLEDRFEEACNLRVGKNLNLNFSCNDVAWNLIDGKLLIILFKQ